MTLLTDIDVSALHQLPAGSTLHPEPVVSVGSTIWLLAATRRHPGDGLFRALLVSPDRSKAAVAPAAAVCGWRHHDLELARQESPDLAPAPVAPEMLGPVTVESLRRHRIVEVFDAPTTKRTWVHAGGNRFTKVAA